METVEPRLLWRRPSDPNADLRRFSLAVDGYVSGNQPVHYGHYKFDQQHVDLSRYFSYKEDGWTSQTRTHERVRMHRPIDTTARTDCRTTGTLVPTTPHPHYELEHDPHHDSDARGITSRRSFYARSEARQQFDEELDPIWKHLGTPISWSCGYDGEASELRHPNPQYFVRTQVGAMFRHAMTHIALARTGIPRPGTVVEKSVSRFLSGLFSDSVFRMVTGTGTSCSRSSRFCAVTSTSSSSGPPRCIVIRHDNRLNISLLEIVRHRQMRLPTEFVQCLCARTGSSINLHIRRAFIGSPQPRTALNQLLDNPALKCAPVGNTVDVGRSFGDYVLGEDDTD